MIFDDGVCTFVCALVVTVFSATAAVKTIRSNTTIATHLFMEVPSRQEDATPSREYARSGAVPRGK